MKVCFILLLLTQLVCGQVAHSQDRFFKKTGQGFTLSADGAELLASLPLKCWEKEFPYKTGITFLDSSFTTRPIEYHPAFYGCFDWHSSVHGHWMLVRLLKQFPNLKEATTIRRVLEQHLSEAHIRKELSIFRAENLSFERIYGWAWLLALQTELLTWNDPLAVSLSRNLKPLADFLSSSWTRFLKKLAYPIRVGEHTNLAFGLSFTWDYAKYTEDTALLRSIRDVAMRFYYKDKNCPATWEPGGYDFLSPCLEEARLMSRLMEKKDFHQWVQAFLPGLFSNSKNIFQIAVVHDRTDGKLVHLDGLNFSRAACLYEIAKKIPAQYAMPVGTLARKHLDAALPNLLSGNYAGEHWLASFALHALSVSK